MSRSKKKAEVDEEAEAKREESYQARKSAAQERVADTRKAHKRAGQLAEIAAAADRTAKAAAAKPPAPKRSGYVVAPGKSICCSSRGIVGPGKSIQASDLCRDADAAKENFAEHLKVGTIVKA